MNKNYTLKELADIGLSAACQFEPNSKFPLSFQNYREAFVKAILDAIGYKFPKDEERKAFDAWCNANHKLSTTDKFEAWKAGREELLKTQALAKEPDTKTEQAWIPWYGGDKSPIVGEQTRYEVECRSGARNIWNTNFLRWSHDGSLGDIIAYRILDSDKCEETKTEPEWWEPEWISWNGGDKSPIVEKQTRYEVEFREGSRHTLTRDVLDWSHNGSICDIVAYRILD